MKSFRPSQAARAASHPAPHSSERGIALIITLFFLVIVSIVVVGFIETARLERTAAGSHFERMRATMMAGEGVERVMATLQQSAGDAPYNANVTTYVPRNWISQPGALASTDLTSTNHTLLTKQVPLSSGAPSASYLSGSGIDLVMRPPDLNTQILVDQSPPTHLLSEATDPTTKLPVAMKVRWVYVRQDGSYDLDATTGLPTEAPVTTNKTNPIVGRFAYWADDESAKVNYNTAWSRDPTLNTNPEGSQTKIDLRAMTGFTDTITNNLHSFITTSNFVPTGSNPKGLNRFFNTPFDARQQGDATTRAALNTNKFNLTHYNADPDTTYYGQPRMMLTTQLSKAVMRDAAGNVLTDSNSKPITRPFLDILKNTSNSLSYIDPGIDGIVSTSDPTGSNGNVDATKLNTVINNLITNYLERSDWPMVDGTGHSIQEKYYSAYTGTARQQRLAQLALNIIDYVRSAESQLNVAQPTRAKWISNVFTPDFINSSIQGTDDTFKGLTRAPHMTELGFWVSDTPEPSGANAGRYRCLAMIEVYLPLNYGLTTLDWMSTDGQTSNGVGQLQTRTTGNKWKLYCGEMTRTYTDPATNTSKPLYYQANGTTAMTNEYTIVAPHPVGSTTSPAFVWDARLETATQVTQPTSKTKMAAGDYRIIAMEAYRVKSKTDLPTVTLRSAITVLNGPRIDVAPLATALTYKLDQNTPSETTISSFENTDPRVNALTNDWGTQSSLANPPPPTLNTFGSQNAAYTKSLATPLSVTPAQDLDASGKVSTASFRMPPPYDTTNATTMAQTGSVWSSGELGLIHSGIEGSNSAPAPPGLTTAGMGVPWRSLHLQPSKQATTVVPDWAFMDLFTVPTTVPVAASALFAPHSNSAGGRVNVNAKPVPFDLERTDPLVAVLYGARTSTSTTTTTLSLTQAQTIAQNIYNHTLSAGGVLPAGKAYPSTATSSLNVYESPGEIAEISGVADQGEDSEELIREIANLVTARGNAFSVYTVGQALKQTPAGKLFVTGEQRQQAMIERYVIGKGTSTPNDDAVGFRTVYFRNLMP